MPELPEVETIRRHLAPVVEGRRLTRLEILDPRFSLPLPAATLVGAVTAAVWSGWADVASTSSGSSPTNATTHNALAFRLKLLLAAGFTPQLAACATCGEREHLSGFSGAAGGVVCAACEANAFSLSQDAHDFLVAALGSPLSAAPAASPRALQQAERAILSTLEHHAHLRLRGVGARGVP